jgi:hypothetical protein
MQEIRSRGGYLIWGTGPALRMSIVASILAVEALRYRAWLYPCDRMEVIQLAEYLFMMCTSFALTALYAGFAERWRLHRFLQLRGLIFPVAALLAVAAFKFGMHQFGAFDENLLVHAGTYYAQGFRPYLDFPCTMPPLFMAVVRWGVRLLGLHWSSFGLIVAAFSAITSLWIYALLRRAAMPRHWALAVTICVAMNTTVAAPFWWYNNSSFIAAILLLVSVLACLAQPKALLPWISLSLSLALVIAAKPNAAPACLMVLALLATKDKSQWIKTIYAGAAALAMVLAICYAAQMPPVQLLHSYAEIAGLRGSPLAMVPFRQMHGLDRPFQFLFLVLNVLGFAALLGFACWRRCWRYPQIAVCTIAALTSFLMACTNAESKNSDLTLCFVAAAFLCLAPWKSAPWEDNEPAPGMKTVLAGLLALFLVIPAFLAATDFRILEIGPAMFYEPLPTQTIHSGFFSGLEAAPRMQKVLAQTADVLSAHPSQKVFFGPRMEFGYALYNKPLTRGMPLLWDVGNLFSRDRFLSLLWAFQQQDPDVLIFLRGDYTRMGPVSYYIQRTSTYQRIDSYSELTVYLRNPNVPISYVKIPPALQ